MTDPATPRPDGPVVEIVQPGRYAWCVCGKSAKLPHCDGTHRGSEVAPVKVEITEEKKVAWCACGKTGGPPWCDGSHKG